MYQSLLQVPNCHVPTTFQVHSSIGAIQDITIVYSTSLLTFSLPSGTKTNVTLTLTDEDGVVMLFENILISK